MEGRRCQMVEGVGVVAHGRSSVRAHLLLRAPRSPQRPRQPPLQAHGNEMLRAMSRGRSESDKTQRRHGGSRGVQAKKSVLDMRRESLIELGPCAQCVSGACGSSRLIISTTTSTYEQKQVRRTSHNILYSCTAGAVFDG